MFCRCARALPPKNYHDFIGFEVSKELLDRAFQDTYGLKLKDLFGTLDLALGTYRFSVSTLLPGVTRAAWALKSAEIEKEQPTVSRRQFLYNITRARLSQGVGLQLSLAGLFARLLTFLSRVLPKVGPLQGLAFKVPTPPTERMSRTVSTPRRGGIANRSRMRKKGHSTL